MEEHFCNQHWRSRKKLDIGVEWSCRLCNNGGRRLPGEFWLVNCLNTMFWLVNIVRLVLSLGTCWAPPGWSDPQWQGEFLLVNIFQHGVLIGQYSTWQGDQWLWQWHQQWGFLIILRLHFLRGGREWFQVSSDWSIISIVLIGHQFPARWVKEKQTLQHVLRKAPSLLVYMLTSEQGFGGELGPGPGPSWLWHGGEPPVTRTVSAVTMYQDADIFHSMAIR